MSAEGSPTGTVRRHEADDQGTCPGSHRVRAPGALSRFYRVEPNWVDIDWSANLLASEEEIQQSLRRLRFVSLPVDAASTIKLVETFRALLTKGGAHVATFKVTDSDDVAAWFISRNRDEYGLADCLVRSSAFAEAMPEVAGAGLLDTTDFERSSPLILDGELARTLVWGGAQTGFHSMAGAKAKALASAFCAGLFGDRYDDIDVDHSWARWSSWFKGIAWDATWVITDRRYRQVTVLVITDTD